MQRDSKAFLDRFNRWKNGEQVYENGLILPKYEDGKDEEPINGGIPFKVTVTGRDRRPTWRRMYENPHLGNTDQYYDKTAIRNITDWFPGIGDVSQGFDAYNATKEGDYNKAAILGGALLLPNALEKPAKYIGKTLLKKGSIVDKYAKHISSRYNDMAPHDQILYSVLPSSVLASIPGMYTTITADSGAETLEGLGLTALGGMAGGLSGYRLAEMLNSAVLKRHYGVNTYRINPRLSKNSITSEYLFDSDKTMPLVSKRFNQLKKGDSYALVQDGDLSIDSAPLYMLQLARHASDGSVKSVKDELGNVAYQKLNWHGYHHSLNDLNKAISRLRDAAGIQIPDARQVGRTIYIPSVYITK